MFKFYGFVILAMCIAHSQAIPPNVLAKIPPEVLDLIYTFRATCTQKFDLTSEDIDNYVITVTDQKYKCYMDCMMHEAKWMDANNVIQYDYITETIHDDVKDLLIAALNKCRDIEDSSEQCGKAWNFNLCMSKADTEHYFLP